MLNLQFHLLTLLCLLVLMSFNIVVVASSFKQQFDYSIKELVSHRLKKELVSHTLNKGLVSHTLKEFTQFSATSSISKTPDPALYQCVKGQQKLISQVFNVSVSIAKSKSIGNVMTIIDLSDYVTQTINSNGATPFVTIISSSDDYFCVFNQETSLIQCKSQIYCKLAHLSVVYQLNLSCLDYYLYSDADDYHLYSDAHQIGSYTKLVRNISTEVEMYLGKKLGLSKTYNDTLLIVSSVATCLSCVIRDQVNVTEEKQVMYLQSQLNAYSYDGSCCVITNSSYVVVGKITKSFPQHWSVRKSEISQDIGEMKYTFPRPGLYQITCCSNENQGTQPQFNAALGIMPGGLNFYYNGSIGIHSKTWNCPSLPPVSVTSIDTQSLWTINTVNNHDDDDDSHNHTCNDIVNLVRDTNCVDQLTRAIQLNVCKLSCSESSLPIVDILSMICHSLTPIIECNLIDVYKLPFYHIQKTFINNGTVKTHRRVTATFGSTEFVPVDNIAYSVYKRSQLTRSTTLGSCNIERLIAVFGYGQDWFLTNSHNTHDIANISTLKRFERLDPFVPLTISMSKYYTVGPSSSHSSLNVVYMIDEKLYSITVDKSYCGTQNETFVQLTINATNPILSIYLSSSTSSEIDLVEIKTDGYRFTPSNLFCESYPAKKGWYITNESAPLANSLVLLMIINAPNDITLLSKNQVDSKCTIESRIEVAPLSCSSHRANWNQFIEEQWTMQNEKLKDTGLTVGFPTTLAVQSNLDIVQFNVDTKMVTSECSNIYNSSMVITGFDAYDSIEIDPSVKNFLDSECEEYEFTCTLIDTDTNTLITRFSQGRQTYAHFEYCIGDVSSGKYCILNIVNFQVNTVRFTCCSNYLSKYTSCYGNNVYYPNIGMIVSSTADDHKNPSSYSVILPDFESCTNDKCGVMTSALIATDMTNAIITVTNNKVQSEKDSTWCGIYASYGSISTVLTRFIVTDYGIVSFACYSNLISHNASSSSAHKSHDRDVNDDPLSCKGIAIEASWTVSLKCCTNSDSLEFADNSLLVANIQSTEFSTVLSSPGVCNLKSKLKKL